jgi:PBSX family phage terminase large subunit
MTMSKITEAIAPSFYGIHKKIKRHEYTHYILKGGRGSMKSTCISVEVLLLLTGHKNCNAVILRKVGNTLRNSVYMQIEWAIDKLGLSGVWKGTVSPMEFVNRQTGQKILFFGVDDKGKIKSIKLAKGYVGVVWYEELDQFSGMEEIRSLNQSLLRGGDIFWVFGSYNPPKSLDNWVNQETLLDEPGRVVHHSTYLRAPKEWLGPLFFEEAEKLKLKNETAYRHEYLGEITGTGGSVFENVRNEPFSDADIENFDRRYYGLDFGFAVDPLAFIVMHYDKKHETLYIFDEIYQQKLSNRRAAKFISYRKPMRPIKADSAEPKSIAELRELGLSVDGAIKGPDSVDFGIRWLQNLTAIVIDKERCPNTYREFATYEYERTKDGQFISAYPDKNNHAIDAVRYGMSDVMRNNRIIAGRVNY